MKNVANSVSLLIVEDDAALRSGLSALVEREGFHAEPVADGESALEALARRDRRIDLVILDLMLPGIDGLAVLRHLRRSTPELPVLILSAKGTVLDKVTLLDAGADDYLIKPFETAELLARLRALLKRAHKLDSPPIRFGTVEVDLAARRVRRGGEGVQLSATQFKVLEALLARPGATVSRETMLDRVWGIDLPESPRVVDYHVLQLRRKLEENPEEPQFIITEPGLGYRVAVDRSGS